MSSAYRMRFVVTDPAVDWTTEVSARPWNYLAPSIGSQRRSAAGIYADYRVNVARQLIIRPRVEEAEIPTAVTFIESVTAPMQPFTLYPDAVLVPATSFLCWLVSPASGGDLLAGLTRMEDYLDAFDFALTIERADTSDPWPVLRWLT